MNLQVESAESCAESLNDFDEEQERTKLYEQAKDFTVEGSRPVMGVSRIEDDPVTYEFHDLWTAAWPYRDSLPYWLDGEVDHQHVDTPWLRERAKLLNPHFELMASEFARHSDILERVIESVGTPDAKGNGEHIGLVSGHDFFLDIMFSLLALRTAVADYYGERQAQKVASQSAAIVNKFTAWQSLDLPVSTNLPASSPDQIYATSASADVLSLVGNVFFSIAPTESTTKAGIHPKVQERANRAMVTELLGWQRDSRKEGKGTITIVAPTASVNKRSQEADNNVPLVIQIPPAVPAISGLIKRFSITYEIASVYDHSKQTVDISTSEARKTPKKTEEIDVEEIMDRITAGSNELAQKRGYNYLYTR